VGRPLHPATPRRRAAKKSDQVRTPITRPKTDTEILFARSIINNSTTIGG